MKKSIRFVLFDWGGTLGRSGERKRFLDQNAPMQQRCSALSPKTMDTLRCLANKGIPLGILSNTAVSKRDMNRDLEETGLSKYFALGLYSSDPGMCKKPCHKIFQKGIMAIRDLSVPDITPREILYVGDNYIADIYGASALGMQTAYITNRNKLKSTAVRQLGLRTYVIDELSDLCHIVR